MGLSTQEYRLTLTILLAVSAAACAGILYCRAQTRGTVKTDRKLYREPAPGTLPKAGAKFTDPIFGAEIMRVTDASDGVEGGTSYSYWPSFNSDNTRLIARTPSAPCSATLYKFNAASFSLLSKEPLKPRGVGCPFTDDAIWSGEDPDVLYLHEGSNLYAYNTRTQTYKLIFNLAKRLSAGYYFWQMSLSLDDDTFAFTLKNATYKVVGYMVYRRSTDSILYQSKDNHDEVRVDKTGRFLVVQTGLQGAGKIQAKVVDLDPVPPTVIELKDDAPDHAPGHYDTGRGIVVGASNYLVAVTERSLAQPHVFKNILDLTAEKEYGSYHVSLIADDESWALISEHGSPANGIFKGELFQVATDGSGRFRRLLHHRSVAREYYDQPRANISRDGRFIAFTSNWGAAGRRDLFVARIEPAPKLMPLTRERPRRAAG